MFAKNFVLALAAACLAMPACAAYKDGTYVGNGEGKGGRMKVKVVVEGGKIADVQVIRHSDTEAIMAGALASIPQQIVAKNTPDVDVVGGATLSCNGIIQGAKNALKKAK